MGTEKNTHCRSIPERVRATQQHPKPQSFNPGVAAEEVEGESEKESESEGDRDSICTYRSPASLLARVAALVGIGSSESQVECEKA